MAERLHAALRRLRWLLRIAKAATRDPRLPRPLRWALALALAIKAVPLPDFGVDEVILLVVGSLLATVYRSRFREIIAEVVLERRKGPTHPEG